jgi:ketosteroid isomerase-like protein
MAQTRVPAGLREEPLWTKSGYSAFALESSTPSRDTAWAMSEENVAEVRAHYERAARGDFDWVADFGDDFEFVTSPEVPDGGQYRGDAAKRWIKTWVNSFEGLTIEATEILDAGDKVLVGTTTKGRLPGSETDVEGRWWNVVTYREGEVARSELFAERTEALEAAGLRE